MPLMDKLLGRSGEKHPEKEHHSHHHHGEPTSATNDYSDGSNTGRVDHRMEPGMNQQGYQSTQMPGSTGAGYGSNDVAGYDSSQGGIRDTSNRYDNNPSSGVGSNSNEGRGYNTHSDGGAYYPPQGTAIGQSGGNAEPAHRNELLNKVDPRVSNDPAYRNQTSGEMDNPQSGYGEPGYNQPGQYQSGHNTLHDKTTQGSTNAGPYNSNLANRIDPRVDSDRHKEQYNTPNDSYGTTTTTTTTGTHTYVGPHDPNTTSLNQGEHYGDSTMPSRHHDHGTGYGTAGMASGATAEYGSTAHNNLDLNREDSVMNRGHPGRESHREHKDERKEEKLERKEERKEEKQHGVDDYQNGPLPGPAPDTAGPHKSNLLNKLDPRVDSDDSKFGKEHHRKHESQPYSNETNTAAGVSQGTYGDQRHGNPMEQRLNDEPISRRDHHEGANERRQEPYGNETSGSSSGRQQGYGNENRFGNEDVGERRHGPLSGYPGQGQATSLPQRKPVNQSDTYGNDASNVGSGQGNNTFQCVKCGHHNTHLLGNSAQNQRSNDYVQGSSNDAPAHNSSMLNKLDPRVPSSTTADNRSGINTTGGNTTGGNPRYY